MANVSAPFGFRQFGQREGTAPTAGLERLFIASSDAQPYFTGDVVQRSSVFQGYLQNSGSSGAITQVPVGVFLGCEYYNASVAKLIWSPYFPGSVGSSSPVNAYVCTNPEQLYIVQGSTGAVLGSTCVGSGVPSMVSGSSLGNTTNGQSVMTVLSSLVTQVTSNACWRIVDIYSNVAPPGVNGTSTGAEGLQIVVVQPNNFERNRPGISALTGAST